MRNHPHHHHPARGRRDGARFDEPFGPSTGRRRHGGFPGPDAFGPDGFVPDGFGRGPGRGPRGPRGPRGRGRARGDVRAAILLLLDERPRHGYELIQEITDRSAGAWTPSPGSIYPTLQALEDEGLVTIERVEGRRTASLTPDGVAHVAEHRERLGTPWQSPESHAGPGLALRREVMALKDAVGQVARVGTPEQHTAATTVLASARKELYRLLAES